MTVRNKILLIIGITLFYLITVLYIVSRIILLGSFAELEQQNTSRNVERILSTLSDNIDNLSSQVGDWAGWDETYEYINNADDDYIKKNLPDNTFTELKLNLIGYINSSGSIVYIKGFDLNNKKEIDVSNVLREHLFVNDLLLSHNSNTESAVKGIILLPEGPMIIASRPILTSERKGPTRGTLIMGRYLDSDEIKRLGSITHLSLQVYNYNDKHMPSDFMAVKDSFSDEHRIIVRELNAKTIAGYALLKDIYGKPVLVLGVDKSREIYQQGLNTMIYFIIVFIITGIVFGIVILLLLDKIVMSRMARISASVSRIGTSNSISDRVPVIGRDELSSLSSAINGMLDALENYQSELKLREDRYLIPVENSPDIIYSLNSLGEITSLNQAGLTFLGYNTIENALGKQVSPHIHPTDREMLANVFNEVINTRKQTSKEIIFRLLNYSGEYVWMELHSTLLFDKEGNYLGRYGTVRDITKRKMVEDELAAEKERLAVTLRSIGEGVITTDTEGRISLVNKMAEEITGWKQVEGEGKTLVEVFQVIDEKTHLVCQNPVQKMVKTGESGHFTTHNTLITKDGTRKIISGSVAHIKDKENNTIGYVLVFQDITERKTFETQLAMSQKLESIG